MVLIAIGFVGISVISEICCPDVDLEAKTELDNLFLGCRTYWLINGAEAICTLEVASRPVYGYVQSSDIKVSPREARPTFQAPPGASTAKKLFTLISKES